MKVITTMFLFLAFVLSSCSKEKIELKHLDSDYAGAFTVYYKDQDKTMKGEVTLRLKDGHFSCSGNPNRFPAGGSGTNHIEEQQIIFEDTNFWTTDFDGALIMNGTFNFNKKGDNLTLKRPSINENTYTYDLKKVLAP
ncbi:hypothetical protein [Sphingobacterium sp. SYP-B4668]|uniref:hypothetical protein n=1 Tax=Sphingobacterium sp. SYP-B4668 TaxID=2996035 RepID=UPI0022DD346C|nr:hypothetical protein [Sphingobacterium sp. SYP-B4668]